MPLEVDNLIAEVTSLGLVTDAAVRQVWTEALAGEDRPDLLLQEFVQRGWLTKFQAKAIRQGKGSGLVLGNYLLQDKLGEGGMGMVFLAEHRRMQRRVAIKVLSPGRLKDAAAVSRFHREIRAVARLTHPNIVGAMDADEQRGLHFYVMEYVEGTDLGSYLKKNGPIPFPEALGYIKQTAQGLEYAHQQGLVHRDIKPSNLLRCLDGTVKILDMGVARLEEDTSRLSRPTDSKDEHVTEAGSLLGTVDYMAPEQALDASSVDHRADIYSLGVALWFLVTGKILYPGHTAMLRLLAHQRDPIPKLVSKSGSIGKNGQALFKKMVAKKPEDRFQSMSEVIAAIDAMHGDSGDTTGEVDSTFPDDEFLNDEFASADEEADSTESRLSDSTKSAPGYLVSKRSRSKARSNPVNQKIWISFAIGIAVLMLLSLGIYYLVTYSGRKSSAASTANNAESPTVNPKNPLEAKSNPGGVQEIKKSLSDFNLNDEQ